MGLDMYLYGQYFIWSSKEDEIKVEGLDLHGFRLKNIEIEVAYWRKANQIHNWFVENVQGGEDDCRDYYVKRDDLKKLLNLCKEILSKTKLVDGKINNGYIYEDGKKIPIVEEGKTIEDPTFASEILPTQGGFFFGSTDYDEYYLHDIEYTVEVLKKALKLPDGWSFEYSSSW